MKKKLSKIEYEVTQLSGTEKPFSGKYYNFFEYQLCSASMKKITQTFVWFCFSKDILPNHHFIKCYIRFSVLTSRTWPRNVNNINIECHFYE